MLASTEKVYKQLAKFFVICCNIARAEDYKNKGKDEFRKKDFHSAINYYTEGIKVNSKDKELTAKLYSNRAAAHIELGKKMRLVDWNVSIFY